MAMTSAEKMAKHRRYMREWYQRGLKTGDPAVLRHKKRVAQYKKTLWRSSAEYRAKQTDLVRNWRFKRNFGITLDQYRTMLAEQGGLCAICRKPQCAMWRGQLKMLAVDHDHQTKQVRGLLCDRCNLTLGQLEESPDLLRRMLDYLTPLSSP